MSRYNYRHRCYQIKSESFTIYQLRMKYTARVKAVRELQSAMEEKLRLSPSSVAAVPNGDAIRAATIERGIQESEPGDIS